MAKSIILLCFLGLLMEGLAEESPSASNITMTPLADASALSCRTVTGVVPDDLNDCQVIEPLLKGLKFEDIKCENCDEQSLQAVSGHGNCRKLTGKVPEEFQDCDVIKKALEGLQVDQIKCDTCGCASLAASLMLVIGTACHQLLKML